MHPCSSYDIVFIFIVLNANVTFLLLWKIFGKSVTLFACLFVYLQDYSKTTAWIIMKFQGVSVLLQERTDLNLGIIGSISLILE